MFNQVAFLLTFGRDLGIEQEGIRLGRGKAGDGEHGTLGEGLGGIDGA